MSTSLHERTLPPAGPLPALPVVLAVPPGARRGIVVLHEIFGREPEIDRVVQRCADAGWAAIAPDLFSTGWKPACIRQAFQAVATGRGPLVDQVLRARDHLAADAGLTSAHMAVIGFCIGGGFALAVGPSFAATSTNYGDVPGDAVLAGLGPTIGCYGGRDRVFGRTGAKLQTTLERLHVPHEVITIPEAGHSFLTDGHHPIAGALSRPFLHVDYDPAIAEPTWTRIFAFLETHVPPLPA